MRGSLNLDDRHTPNQLRALFAEKTGSGLSA